MIALRYGTRFGLSIAAMAVAATLSFARLAHRGDARSGSGIADTATAATNVAQIRPRREEYDRYAAEDAAWRKRNARAASARELKARSEWHPSARQALNDRVYRLVKEGKRAEAITELERWVLANPRDAVERRWLARLLNEEGRTDEAIVHYQRLLTLYEND